MTKQQVKTVYVLSFVIAASLTMQVLAIVEGQALTGATLPELFSLYPTEGTLTKDEQQAARREYQEMLTKCDDAVSAADDERCPDVNNKRAMRRYIKAAVTDEHAAPRNFGLRVGRLSSEDRALLQKYRDEGRCPQTLRRYLPGFYELCLSLVVDIANREIDTPIHGAAPSQMELRRQERLRDRMEK